MQLPRALETYLVRTALLSEAPSLRAKPDFTSPPREAALVSHDSVAWQIFKNPLAILVGGIASVLLELGEPRIRSAIWKNSSFLEDPLGRLRRTGMAAMVTIFGAQSVSAPMIARVARLHSRIAGVTPSGNPYAADDPQLLNWVHTTAAWSFATAYTRYVHPLQAMQLDAYFEESAPVATLYGALDVPRGFQRASDFILQGAEMLEPSDALGTFCQVMASLPWLPLSLRWVQPIAVRAAIDILPDRIRCRLNLQRRSGLRVHQEALIRIVAKLANRLMLPTSPACQSCVRLGLPANYLYR